MLKCLSENNVMLEWIQHLLFGSGKVSDAMIKEAGGKDTTPATTTTTSQTTAPEDECSVLARHFGGLVSGRTYVIELRELLEICPRKRKKADSYYQLKKKLKEDYGVELRITSRTSKNREDEE